MNNVSELLEQLVAALQEHIVPIGCVQAFATSEAPDGWRLCDGSKVLKIEYPELYQAIGSTFGDEDDDTFMLPDLRGMFIRGWDSDGAIDFDRKLGSKQLDAFQGHRHESFPHSHGAECTSEGGHYHKLKVEERNTVYDVFLGSLGQRLAIGSDRNDKLDSSVEGSHSHTISIKNATALIGSPAETDYGKCRIDTETRPRNVALLYCIKCTPFELKL